MGLTLSGSHHSVDPPGRATTAAVDTNLHPCYAVMLLPGDTVLLVRQAMSRGWLAAGWRQVCPSLRQLMTSVSLPVRGAGPRWVRGDDSEEVSPGPPRVSASAARRSGRMRRGRLRRRGVSRSSGPCGARWGERPPRRDVVRSSSRTCTWTSPSREDATLNPSPTIEMTQTDLESFGSSDERLGADR